MKCSRVKLSLLHRSLLSILLIFFFFTTSNRVTCSEQTSLVDNQRVLYNRMVCENEKLSIHCQPSHVIQVERAYYGRYSITPCNKDHRKFSKGCTAADSLSIIRNLCDANPKCEVYANSSTFGVPCPNDSVHILEVIYSCIKSSIIDSIEPIGVSNKTSSRNDQSNKKLEKTTTTTTITSTETKTTTTITTTTTIHPYLNRSLEVDNFDEEDYIDIDETSEEYLTSNRTSEYDEEELLPITCRTRVDNTEFSAHLGDYINLPCSSSVTASASSNAYLSQPLLNSPKQDVKPEYELISGFMLYECRADGNFYFINSTCTKRKPLQQQQPQQHVKTSYFGENIIYVKESLSTIEKLNNHLINDVNDTLIATNRLDSIINFILNVSDTFYNSDYDSRPLLYNISETLINSVNTLISKTSGWKSLPSEERAKSMTKLLNLVDDLIFDNLVQRIDNYLDESKKIVVVDRNQHVVDFTIDRENIYAEMRTNVDLRTRIEFPRSTYHKLDEDKLLIDLHYGEKNQKFLYMVYKNMNDLIMNDSNINKSTNESVNYMLDSNIVSIKINDINVIDNLRQSPVEITFKHLRPAFSSKRICVFWNYDKSFDGEWSKDGCFVFDSNYTHTICKCNHITHFALMSDVQKVGVCNAQTHRLAHTILIICLACVSCIGIVLTYSMFRFVSTLKSNRDKSSVKRLELITTHLCVSLLVSLLVFLLGVAAKHFNINGMCSKIAIAAHFITLCSFAWMLLQVVHLYFMIDRKNTVKKSSMEKKKPLSTTRLCLIAYGIPFLVVVASRFIDVYLLNSRGYQTASFCWISSYANFSLTFVIPLVFILFVNLVLLVRVVYSARMINSMTDASRTFQLGTFTYRNRKKKEDQFFRSLFWTWCLLLTLFSLPWLIIYYSATLDSQQSSTANTIFSYTFLVINTWQGTLIFVVHFLASKPFRHDLIRAAKSAHHSSYSRGKSFTPVVAQSQSSSTNLTSTTAGNMIILSDSSAVIPAAGDRIMNLEEDEAFINPNHYHHHHHQQHYHLTHHRLNHVPSSVYYSSSSGSKHQNNNRVVDLEKRTSSFFIMASGGSNAPTSTDSSSSSYTTTTTATPSSQQTQHKLLLPLPPLPLVPPPQPVLMANNSDFKSSTLVRMNTFKPSKSLKQQQHQDQQQKRTTTTTTSSNMNSTKYDENQYLSPATAEYHSYSAVLDSETQFYMDDGLSSLKRYKQVEAEGGGGDNNYVEVMDEMDEFNAVESVVTSSATSSSVSVGFEETSSIKIAANSAIESSSAALTAAVVAKSALIDSNENLKAKKILQRI